MLYLINLGVIYIYCFVSNLLFARLDFGTTRKSQIFWWPTVTQARCDEQVKWFIKELHTPQYPVKLKSGRVKSIFLIFCIFTFSSFVSSCLEFQESQIKIAKVSFVVLLCVSACVRGRERERFSNEFFSSNIPSIERDRESKLLIL